MSVDPKETSPIGVILRYKTSVTECSFVTSQLQPGPCFTEALRISHYKTASTRADPCLTSDAFENGALEVLPSVAKQPPTGFAFKVCQLIPPYPWPRLMDLDCILLVGEHRFCLVYCKPWCWAKGIQKSWRMKFFGYLLKHK